MFALILTFCTLTSCNDFRIDYNLTKDDCMSALQTKRHEIDAIETQAEYREFMVQYKAEKLFDSDDGVAWSLKCDKQAMVAHSFKEERE